MPSGVTARSSDACRTRSHIRADADAIAVAGNQPAFDIEPHQLAVRMRFAFFDGLATDEIVFLGFQRHGKAYACFKRIGFV